jgi:hypothetical protein
MKRIYLGIARVLRDAAAYIARLPRLERECREWRLAVQMLIDAAEDRGPMLFAKIGIQRAMERRADRLFNPSANGPH